MILNFIITLPQVKQLSGEASAQIKHRLQSKTALNKYVCGFWCERTTGDGCFHLRKRCYGFKPHILAGNKLKTHWWWICFLQTCSFWLIKMLWTGVVDYCNVFISCLDSHSDGTHSLQGIHWGGSDVMLNFSKYDEETNSSTFWMIWGWAHCQQIFILGWTLLLRATIVSPE